ncbi:MAG TPA: hypothetical protein VKV23_04665 [Acidimicrobiales bacterium]|nr:hypothetical protein [Acidimicrobiales bacterium]
MSGWWSRWLLRRVAPHRLVAQCELFLDGDVPRADRRREPSTSPWISIHPLAHGDARRLRRLARSRFSAWRRESPLAGPWASVTRQLAGELLQLTRGDPATLLRVQRDVLVPLELRLLSPGASILEPEALQMLVHAGLSGERLNGPAGST